VKGASLFFFLLYCSISGFAQSRSNTGVVKDAETSEPVAFCNVSLLNSTTGTVTDVSGKFELFIPASSNTNRLLISFTGYLSDTISLQSEKSHYIIFLKPALHGISEVVVSGTMKEISKMESAIPVEVYTPALFKKNPSPTLFESLNMVTGVQPQLNCNVCNTGDIHINGLEGPYTMILIDGMPVVSSLSTVYGLHGIPQSMVKRIEIVKGPASTLYGSEAVAGLINVITKDPFSSPKFKADILGTSLGEFNFDISSKWNAGKRASSLLGMNYFNYLIPADVNDDNFTDVTLQNRFSVFNKWNFERKSEKKATLATRYMYENRWGGEMQYSDEWRGTDSIYGESIFTNRIELIGTYGLPFKNENLRFDYSYNYHLQDSYYGTTKYYANQHTAFAQLVWDKELGRINLLAGVPFRFIYYDDNSPATASSDSLHRNNEPALTYLPGVFFQGEIKWSKKITILAGARYEHNNVHGSIWTPRLSFKYSPNANHTFRLTGGSGFRVVNLFTEDHAALTGAREVVIQNELQPERSWNGNLNYTGYIPHEKGYIGMDASLFYTYFTNQITGDFFTDPNKIIYDNLDGYAVSRGLTVNLDISFIKGLKLITGFTLMDVYRMLKSTSEVFVKTPQLYAPDFSTNFAVSYSINKIGLSIDWTGKVTGPMHLPVVPNDFRPEMSPWFCLMNIQFSKRLPKNIELYAGAKNLLNFIPKNPILRPFDPFDKNANDPVNNPNGYTFDPSYNFSPIQGIKGFLGLRWTID